MCNIYTSPTRNASKTHTTYDCLIIYIVRCTLYAAFSILCIPWCVSVCVRVFNAMHAGINTRPHPNPAVK